MLRCRERERRAGIEISIIAWAENRQVACLAEIPYLKKGSQVDVFGTSGGCFGVYKDPSGRFGGLGSTTSAYIMRKLRSPRVEVTLELPTGRQPQ